MKKTIIILTLLFCITLSFSNSEKREKFERLSQEFKVYAAQVQETWGVPGMAIGIVNGEEVVFKEVFGYRSHEKKEPVDFDTTFQIGSTSKAFTATLIAMGVQHGFLNWTDKVRQHYPEFEMYDPYVTANMEIRDVMAQHSGMASYSGDLTQMMGFDAQYLLEHLKDIKPVHTFRTDYSYVNSLFLVAEKVIGNLTGLSFEEALQRFIFDPLGMEHTTVNYEKHLSNENKTMTYVHEVIDGEVGNRIVLKRLDPHAKGFIWSYNYAPAGGIDSSLNDMLEWVKFHVNNGSVDGKQLLEPHIMNVLYQPQTLVYTNKYGKYVGYCQGWVYETIGDEVMIWHNGSTMGSKTMVAFFPKQEVGIVILTNVGGTNLPDNLVKDFLDMITGKEPRQLALKEVQEVLAANIPEETQTSDVYPPMKAEVYTGKYFNELYGELEVYTSDETLLMKIGPDDSIMELRHLNRDSFAIYWDELHLGEVANCTFVMGSNDKAVKIEVDLLEKEGTGCFTRVE